jgi:hypothetical protein
LAVRKKTIDSKSLATRGFQQKICNPTITISNSNYNVFFVGKLCVEIDNKIKPGAESIQVKGIKIV